MLNLELFFCVGGCVHLWHVENFKHRKEIEVGHVYAFEDDLSNDKIDILLFQLYFFEEFEKRDL